MEEGMINNTESNKMFDLSGRITLVTGGERGLGKAMAEAVAEFGSDIVINYPFPEAKAQAEETVNLIAGLGVRTQIIQADVSRVEEVDNMFREIRGAFGRIDVLINNAGITSRAAWVHEMSVDDWDRVINVNLRGSFLCMKYALPIMINQKHGSIINVSSVTALRVSSSKFLSISNYSASKAGLLALTRQAAADYASYGIRVNAIALGYHGSTSLTSEWKKSWSKEMLKEYAEMVKQQTPMGRRGKEAELKGLVVLLASEASSFITGQTIVQDGGLSL
jgi:NAD(P)-dependent dehydrogenase (short-subunit alcohol dehydrogenase family)